MIAAHFASEGENHGAELAVWAFNTEFLGKAPERQLERTIILFQCPRHEHSFLHAQAGLFTWSEWTEFSNHLLSFGYWPSMIDLIAHDAIKRTDGVFRKVTLPTSELGELRHILRRERLSRAHLMPTLDNVAVTLLSRWHASDL
jgi:hypothetical protein